MGEPRNRFLTLRAEIDRLRSENDALKAELTRQLDAIAKIESASLPDTNSEHPDLIWREDVFAALSSTPTPRSGFDCAMCGHRHQDERFAFICIGCRCQNKPATPTPETT